MWDWLSGLSNDAVFAGILAQIVKLIKWLISILILIFQFLYRLLVGVFNFFHDFLAKVGGFFKSLWTGFFRTVFTDLIKALRSVHKWLETKLGPIIKFLKDARDRWDRMYKTYVRPIMNLLQNVRKVLSIFRALHIHIADVLDRWIGRIEGKIAGAFLAARSIFTGMIDILNALADPLNLLRRPTLVLSIRRIMPAIVRATTGLPIGYFLPSPRKDAPYGQGRLPLAFNPADPAYNPPPSSYFSQDDGLGLFSGFADGQVPDDGAVDDLTVLEYFDDGLYDAPLCGDAVQCLTVLQQRAFAGIVQPSSK